MDNRILFLQKCLLKSSPHFIRLLSDLLNLIGCRGKIKSKFSKKVCFSKNISRLNVTYMFMVFATSLVVVLFLCYCRYFDELLQQCFLFLAHLSRRLTGELLVYTCIWRPSVVPRPSVRPSSVVCQHFQTTSPLKPSGGFFPYYTYSI